MTILYSCVARGTNVLCSNQTGNGNFPETLHSMLPNIPTQNDGKKTYTSNNFEFHCLIENGILFICATNSGVSKQQPYGFLNEIKKRFQSGALAGRAVTASAGDLDRDFNFVLSQQMEKYSQPGAGANQAVATIQAQIDGVKDVMTQNIEKVLQRGERLEDLMDKSEELEAGASSFQKTARKIQKRYWWRNKKMTLILACVVFVILFIILMIILYYTGVLTGGSSDADNKGTTTVKP
ncbi:unnamed protein product [Lymnaea stagnalis]|uniref:Vesicle-associated membrane protein 7 n=1 Tax=Lymnaea stagnalis TaxID=6523 RepID=A0AAV2H1A6_LYMST